MRKFKTLIKENIFITSLLAFALLTVTSTFAQEQQDYEPHPKQLGIRLFRAYGQHQCQSDESIGHLCRVENVGFTDCREAYLRLEAQDCCPRSEFGGNSIHFELQFCSWWH